MKDIICSNCGVKLKSYYSISKGTNSLLYTLQVDKDEQPYIIDEVYEEDEHMYYECPECGHGLGEEEILQIDKMFE